MHDLYEIWAPPGGRWSPWVKPILFLHLEGPDEPAPSLTQMDVSWVRSASEGAAVVVDLPGAAAIACAMELARMGFRPVPLYNTHANPAGAVDMKPILSAMRAATAELQRLAPSLGAPPAFILDANRLAPNAPLKPLVYDNRWLVFPQDFPSGSFLQASGITRVVVVQSRAGQPSEDLRHVLLRWQEAGIGVRIKRADDTSPVEAIEIRKPSRFRSVWHRWLALAGFRRNAAGGFGSIIPEPSSGGAGFA